MYFARAVYVVIGLAVHYFGYRKFLRSPQNKADRPKKLVEFLLKLGPVFVKIGQILSTRPDIIHQNYVDELSVLQEAQPFIDWSTVKSEIEREFASPIEDLFDKVDTDPVAAATLAQVHRAWLNNGKMVAVKVQRPNVASQIAVDMKLLAGILVIAKFLFPVLVKRSNLLDLFTEFRKYTLQELDFANEANTMASFKEQFSNFSFVKIPRVYEERTSSKVLTMDWVEGATIKQALNEFEPLMLRNMAKRLVEALLTMFVGDGHYHADLHPGNVRFHKDGTCTFMDFGMSGRLIELQCDRFVLYMSAVVLKQTERAFSIFIEQTIQAPDADEEAFRRAFFELAERFYNSTLFEVSFAKVYVEMMQAGYKCGFKFPSELILHGKALTTAESLVFTLMPEARFDVLAQEHVATLVFERTTARLLSLLSSGQSMSELVLLGRIPKGPSQERNPRFSSLSKLMFQYARVLPLYLKATGENHEFWRVLFTADVEEILHAEQYSIDIGLALDDTWAYYDELEVGLKVYDTLGAIFTSHVAILIIAMKKALMRQGLDATAAAEAIRRIGWKFYNRLGEVPLQAARSFTKDPLKRMKITTDIFRKFPFGEPSYKWVDVRGEASNIVAFDCHKCPMAEVFFSHGEGDLCVRTACELDFPLAKKWGGKLARTGTIAGGAKVCDFRWELPD